MGKALASLKELSLLLMDLILYVLKKLAGILTPHTK